VTEKPQDEDRQDRDRDRSSEAHWRAAEAATDQAGGPTQKTPKGLEIPVPKHRDVTDALRKLAQPVKKKP
jgi:hypothetical protein